MRDYGKIGPGFWTGTTGKRLRGDKDAQVVALYLMTCPHSSMIGVFHCPVTYISHDTGLTSQGASKGLRRLVDDGFCTFDEDRDLVWVHEMARFQIADRLSLSDNRVKSTGKEFSALPKCLIKKGFYEKYKGAFHLPEMADAESSSEAPSKALRSQEQEQEQEQEKDLLSETSSDQPAKTKKATYTTEFEAFWQAYPRTPNMSKPKAFSAWCKLAESDRAACMAAVAPYCAFLKAKTDHPVMHATTFINERRFDGFLEQSAASAPKPITEDDWQKRLAFGRKNSKWHVEQWGPFPGAADCRVPEHLVQPGDGQGWSVWEA